MMPLAVLMNREIRHIDSALPLREAARQMAEHRVGALLVKRSGEYVGILSETDLVRRAMSVGLEAEVCPVEKIMSSPLITIDVNKTLVDANEIMSGNRIRHLVVTDRGSVVGVISVRDLVIYFKNRL